MLSAWGAGAVREPWRRGFMEGRCGVGEGMERRCAGRRGGVEGRCPGGWGGVWGGAEGRRAGVQERRAGEGDAASHDCGAGEGPCGCCQGYGLPSFFSFLNAPLRLSTAGRDVSGGLKARLSVFGAA